MSAHPFEDTVQALEMWRGRRKALDAQLDALRAVLNISPESPLLDAIEDIWDAYTRELGYGIGDTGEWLAWYQFDCLMGDHPLSAIPKEGAPEILCDSDLRNLARVILSQ